MLRIRQPVAVWCERMFALVFAIAALSLVSCADTETGSEDHDDDHVAHWGYEADDGPHVWGSMDPAWVVCAEGQEQSPIDLANATRISLPPGVIDMPSDQEVELLNQAGVIDALDNGHTIQINAMTGETMTVGEKTYALVQFHFHAPSEHTVDGEHYPMELHFVYRADNGALAVVGVLIEEGAHNPGIEPLWGQLAEVPGTAATVRIPAEFDRYIFPDDSVGVFHYSGSLTTPPCTEGVQWYVRKIATQFSKDQIATFTAVYDHNNRPVQPLNDRRLYLDETPTVTIQ